MVAARDARPAAGTATKAIDAASGGQAMQVQTNIVGQNCGDEGIRTVGRVGYGRLRCRASDEMRMTTLTPSHIPDEDEKKIGLL